MTVPTLQAEGATLANTTGTLSPTIPTHQANDIVVVAVVYWGPATAGDAAAIPTPTNYNSLVQTGQPVAANRDGRYALFWRRVAAAGTTVTVSRGASWDTGTDTCFAARAYVIRGCITTGNPFDAPTTAGPYTTANGALASATPSRAESLLVQFGLSMDNQAFAMTATGYTTGTEDNDATGTDCSFQTARRQIDGAITSTPNATVSAPAQGGYIFYGVPFIPAVASPISVAVAPAGAAWSARPASPGLMGRTVAVAAATAAWSAQPVAVSNPPQVALAAATAAWSARPISPAGAATTRTLGVAAAAWSARPMAPTTGARTVALAAAAATWVARPVAPAGAATPLPLAPAVATWAAQPLAPSVVGTTVALLAAAATWAARALQPATGGATVAVQPATTTWQARPMLPAGAARTVACAPAVAGWQARPVTPSVASITVALHAAVAAWTAPPLAPTATGPQVLLGSALATWVAVAITPAVDAAPGATLLAVSSGVRSPRASAGPASPIVDRARIVLQRHASALHDQQRRSTTTHRRASIVETTHREA